eukprot:6053178-Amphidinium_carterae.2
MSVSSSFCALFLVVADDTVSRSVLPVLSVSTPLPLIETVTRSGSGQFMRILHAHTHTHHTHTHAHMTAPCAMVDGICSRLFSFFACRTLVKGSERACWRLTCLKVPKVLGFFAQTDIRMKSVTDYCLLDKSLDGFLVQTNSNSPTA